MKTIFVISLIFLLSFPAFSETWKDDCNTCTGDKDGVYGCTQLFCAGNDITFGELNTTWMNEIACRDQIKNKAVIGWYVTFNFGNDISYELGRRSDGVVVSRIFTSCEKLYGKKR